MTRYQLAKLVEWAGTLRSRKRLQKVVYLLQAAGCPLGADFFLHFYGPYSEDVARLADEMVREHLLEETTTGAGPYEQYNYQITANTLAQMAKLEGSPRGEEMLRELAGFEDKARALLSADLRQLEYAATIVFFYQRTHKWEDAAEKAATFKNDAAVKAALVLAQQAIS